MAHVDSIGTYLPSWGTRARRVPGDDEDALTLAVEAGRAALVDRAGAQRVVLVSRDLPLLEGGNAAVLLAGLVLDPDIEVSEILGGAPAVLDAVSSARPHTLVIGADTGSAGAAAAIIGGQRVHLRPAARVNRSLPGRTRAPAGHERAHAAPRRLRRAGLRS